MAVVAENALIVQSDNTVLLEVHSPRAEAAREALAPFAELVKSPEHVHTYRLTPLSIWNARSAGLSGATMIAALREHAKYAVPDSVVTEVGELAARYGRVVLTREGDALVCTCRDRATAERLARDRGAGGLSRRSDRRDTASACLQPARRSQAGPRRGWVPGGGPGWLRGGRRAAGRSPGSVPLGPGLRRARLPARGGRRLLPGRVRARRQRGHRPALRRRQDRSSGWPRWRRWDRRRSCSRRASPR